MHRIAIVEDDATSSKELQGYIARYGSENSLEFRVDSFSNGFGIVDNYKPVWDLILLDIDMPLMDGMIVARRIREKDDSVMIVFITNLAQYAIQGYDVSAFDYVLKPVNYHAFAMKMRKIVRAIGRRAEKTIIAIDGKGDSRRVPVSDIRYVEVLDHKLVYHRANDALHSYGSLKELEQALGDSFARCNHCFLVNLSYVDGFSGEEVIVGGTALKISRTRRKQFLQRVSDYYC